MTRGVNIGGFLTGIAVGFGGVAITGAGVGVLSTSDFLSGRVRERSAVVGGAGFLEAV